MNLLSLVFLTITLVLTPPTTPVLKSQSDGTYIAVNPLKKPIEMTIVCGDEWDPVHVKIPPTSSFPLSMVEPDSKNSIAVGCTMESYHIAK